MVVFDTKEEAAVGPHTRNSTNSTELSSGKVTYCRHRIQYDAVCSSACMQRLTEGLHKGAAGGDGGVSDIGGDRGGAPDGGGGQTSGDRGGAPDGGGGRTSGGRDGDGGDRQSSSTETNREQATSSEKVQEEEEEKCAVYLFL